jgi:DNA-binding NtrC family response regulator
VGKILLVDDESKMRHLLAIMVEGAGHEAYHAADGEAALKLIRENHFDMVITDIKMPRMDGITLLQRIKAEEYACPVIFITAFATVDSAVEAMQKGAADYITKPYEEDRIRLSIERTMNLSNLIRENKALRQALQQEAAESEIIYVSGAMRELMMLVDRVADSDTAVLISGESGTGKELLAKYVHAHSARKRNRFVPVNCAAISAGLVESELFGHEKGAFTGAEKQKIGKFEYASGGTLFLDEIGDMPLETQAKFLRALQEKSIQRVGGNDDISVDVRVICATNQNLPELIDQGKFRKDLYFRINVFPITSPPLRQRKEDVLHLARYFLEKMAPRGRNRKLLPEAEKILNEYDWPGNVRELSNAIERALIIADPKGGIGAASLSFLQTSASACLNGAAYQISPDGISLEKVERDFVRQALSAAGNNQTAAARLLGLSRAKFRVLLKQLEE